MYLPKIGNISTMGDWLGGGCMLDLTWSCRFGRTSIRRAFPLCFSLHYWISSLFCVVPMWWFCCVSIPSIFISWCNDVIVSPIDASFLDVSWSTMYPSSTSNHPHCWLRVLFVNDLPLFHWCRLTNILFVDDNFLHPSLTTEATFTSMQW